MRALARLLAHRHIVVPLVRWAMDLQDGELDPWHHLELEVGPHWFGSRFDFWRYLEGHSAVEVAGVDDICQWLVGCDYVSDPDLFQEADYWQHPLTFEQLRKGDCEDHALWAWRKLGELGLSARFYIGRWQWDPEDPSFHAWVVFEDAEGKWLLETTDRDGTGMKRPLEEARGEYRPHLSIGHFRDARVYGGWIEYQEWRRGWHGT